MNIDRILELDRQALDYIAPYKKKRFAFDGLEKAPGRPFIALIGPRGVGKTILLRQIRALYEGALYISADTLGRNTPGRSGSGTDGPGRAAPGTAGGETSLKELVRHFHTSMGINRFFVDEIHFFPEYAADLKELYDFSQVRIWFSSSVALALYESSWDLSRRVRTVRLGPFSLREYLYFRYDLQIDALDLGTVFEGRLPVSHMRLSPYFEEYIRGGLYPFLLEAGSDFEQFFSIKEKIIHDDIPNFDRSINREDVSNIEKIFSFIGKSPIDGINYSSAAKNIGITKYRAEKYLALLQRSFLLFLAFPKGTNVLKEPKVFMELPWRLLFRDYDECVGELREDFFALAMQQYGKNFYYLKTNRGQKTPDFLLEGKEIDGIDRSFVIEVGGKGKGRSQFKGITYDKKIVVFHRGSGEIGPRETAGYAAGDRIPLHILGFAEG